VRYWRYRAYDANFRIHDGVTKAADFVHMAVNVRQGGLQLIDAWTIDPATYRAELRLEHQRDLLVAATNPSRLESHILNTRSPETTIRRILRWFLTYF
jgi:hypothetical protein